MRQRIAHTLMLILGIWMLTRTSPATAGEVRIPVGPMANIELTVEVRSMKEMRETGITLQQRDYSCGSAALATLFTSYLGQPYSELEVIDFIAKSTDLQKVAARRGFSLLDLKRFAEAHGVQATGYALDFDSLCELEGPVLVPLYHKETDMRHFVIFRGVIGNRVFLADPAIGRQTMFRGEFEALWNPRVGMVFNHAGMPPAADSPLGLHPDDELFLSADSIRAVVLQSAIQFIHHADEF